MNKILTSRFIKVFFIMLFVAFITVIVWSSYTRQVKIIEAQYERQVFERLSNLARSLGNDTGAEFHLGRYISAMVGDSVKDSLPVEDKTSAIAEILERENERFSDKFAWGIFDVSAIRNQTDEQFEHSVLKREKSYLRTFPPEISQFLAARLLAIITGLKLSHESNWIFKNEIEPRIDERTGSDQARFLCSAVGAFQSLIVDDSRYHLLFIPIFSKSWKANTDWLAQTKSSNAFIENRKNLEQVVVIAFDQDNFLTALNERLLNCIQKNMLRDNYIVAFYDLADSGGWKIPSQLQGDAGLLGILQNYEAGDVSKYGWIKVDAQIPGLRSVKAVIASKSDLKGNPLKKFEKALFIGIMLWVVTIIFICGQYVLLGKVLNLSLKYQLVMIGFAFLLPVFLLGILTGERYFASRSAAFIHHLQKKAEHAVIEMDSSVQMHHAALCGILAGAADMTFSPASRSVWLGMNEKEKSDFLGAFLANLSRDGIVMRNLMIVEKNGEVNARLRGSSKSEDKFFRELCSAIFLPVLRTTDSISSSVILNEQKDVMLKVQADEMLDAMKNMVSQYFFLKMSYLPVLLSQIEGLGDRAFIYHSYLTLMDRIDAVMMMSLYPPSLDSRSMEMWIENFDDKMLSGAQWLMQYKDTPGWYIRRPFTNDPQEGVMGLLRFDYDLLPADLAYWTMFSGMRNEASVLKIFWQGQDWLLATIPGKNLIDYQVSLMIPLGEHYKTKQNFEKIFQSGLVVVFLLCMLLGNLMASSFLQPVEMFAATANSFMAGKLSARLPDVGYDLEFAQISEEFNRVASDVESGRVLRRFVSEDALRIINLEQENRFEKSIRSLEAIVFFVRLADFFQFTARNDPPASLAELNRFFSIFCQEIGRAGGEVNKFISEKAMGTVFFVGEKEKHCKTIAVLRAIAGTAARYRINGGQCRMRAGLSTGLVRSGILGTEDVRLEQTVIGDTVNLAARLCSIDSRATVLICENTAACIESSDDHSDKIILEKLPSQLIKGKKKNVDVFAIKG